MIEINNEEDQLNSLRAVQTSFTGAIEERSTGYCLFKCCVYCVRRAHVLILIGCGFKRPRLDVDEIVSLPEGREVARL